MEEVNLENNPLEMVNGNSAPQKENDTHLYSVVGN